MERKVFRYHRQAAQKQYVPPELLTKPEVKETAQYQRASKLRSSDAWKKLRAAVLSRYPVCCACGSAAAVEVHHRQPASRRPELFYTPANLAPLCSECHNAIHSAEARRISADLFIPAGFIVEITR